MGLDEYLSCYGSDKSIRIVIASSYVLQISQQLKDIGIVEYEIYHSSRGGYYPYEPLIVNPYERKSDALTEQQYIDKTNKNIPRDYINNSVDYLTKTVPIFSHIEIETLNRCNGVCDFCPVSVQNEVRSYIKMDTNLFTKIIDELADFNYSGRICLFSNNEAFMDDRIIEFHKFTRERLPNARTHLFTNGTLLTLEKFVEVIPYLDELIIDNYNQQLNLIPNVKEIANYCSEHEVLKNKVTIVLRKPKEILTTRGEEAPNRKQKEIFSFG